MGRDSMLEDSEGRRQKLGVPEEPYQGGYPLGLTSGGDLDHRAIRFGPLTGCVMTTKPRRAGSKGIRIYYHTRTGRKWDRTRESHNYFTGLDAVRTLAKDSFVKILGVGCESGAMCLHYTLR